MTRLPKVGDFVMYQALGTDDGRLPSVPRTAVVDHVYGMRVDLTVLGVHAVYDVEYDENCSNNTWHWEE